MSKQLYFDHVKRDIAPEYLIDHVDKAMSSIMFDRYINQTYFEGKKAKKNGTYNPNRALRAF